MRTCRSTSIILCQLHVCFVVLRVLAISALVIRLFYCHVYKWTTDPYHNKPFPTQEL
jgi:hypothetical protein